MTKAKLLIASAMLGIVILSIGCQPNNPVVVSPTSILLSPTPSTQSQDTNIHIAWFYKPPENGTIDSLPTFFDTFILTHKDEDTRDQLLNRGVKKPILEYLALLEIQDPGSCTAVPYGNQVAYQPGDFCQISDQHPNWFLLDQNGNRIEVDGKYYYMDPGNAEYRTFWLLRARQLQNDFHWNGIFIDNVEAGLGKLNGQGVTPTRYIDDVSYQQAVQGFLAFLAQNGLSNAQHPLMANIIALKDKAVWFSYLQYLNGAMIENFATDWKNRYFLPPMWEDQLNMIDDTVTQMKSVILVAQGEQADLNRQEFAFASYLLVKSEQVSFRYTNDQAYEQIWLYNNYQIELGAPLGSRYRQELDWRRDFENGYVTVNPISHAAAINLTK